MKNFTIVILFIASFNALAVDEMDTTTPQAMLSEVEQFKTKFNAIACKLQGIELLVAPGKIAHVGEHGQVNQMSSEEELEFLKILDGFLDTLNNTVTEAEIKFKELKQTYQIYKEYKTEEAVQENTRVETIAEAVSPQEKQEKEQLAFDIPEEQPQPQPETPTAVFHHWQDTIYYCPCVGGVIYYDAATGQQWFMPYQIQ